MKRLIALILILLLSAGLAACGIIRRPVEPPPSGPAVPESPASPEQPEAPQPEGPEIPATEVTNVIMELDYNEQAQVTGHITAFSIDGNVAWEYVTNACYVGQCDVLQAIGVGPGGYMFLETGSIYCLDLPTGEVLWVNEDFGGESAYWDFDEAGNLYLTGYFGPWLFGIDPGGNTIVDYRTMPAEYEAGFFWPASLSVDTADFVHIRYSSNDMILIIDPDEGEVLDWYWYTEALDIDFLAGTWVDDEENPTVILTIYPDSDFVPEAYDFFFTLNVNEETTYYYEGRFKLDTLYDDDSPGKDWLRSELVDTNDPMFEYTSNIGDFIVTYSYRGDDAPHCIYLAQVNNGDSLFSINLNAFGVHLHKLSDTGPVG